MTDEYYVQPILDALRACVTGEFARWSFEQHEHLLVWIQKYPNAVGQAAAQFLDEQPSAIAHQEGRRRPLRPVPTLRQIRD